MSGALREGGSVGDRASRLSAPDDIAAALKLKGANFFHPIEQTPPRPLQRAKFNIAAVRRAGLALLLEEIFSLALSCRSRRLRDLGSIKRIAKTRRRRLVGIGRRVIVAAFQVTEYTIVPALS
jgi:hypothetical protein